MITVTDILDGGKVRLGIEAPRDVVITRTELLTDARRAEIEAASTAPARSGGPDA